VTDTIRLLFAACCLLTLVGLPASAQQSADAPRSPLPSHLPLRTEACFGRIYDREHLAQHPRQRVTGMHLFRDFTPDPLTETTPMTAQELREQDGQDGNVIVTAYVRFRDKPGLFSNGLSCRRQDDGRIHCGIDCDGGGFKLRTSGQSLLLENEGFVVVGGCGASEDEQERMDHVSPGADDKLFRLDRKPVAECAALRDAGRPAYARLGSPLRERLARADTACFARTYDDAHLARNPRQTVRRIAIVKAKATGSDDVEAPTYRLTFRIETRDGRRFEQSASCSPDSYAYACSPSEPVDDWRDFHLTRAGADHVMLRDRRGSLAKLLKARLSADDRTFRLETAPASACAF
jgi:hypothetical protein